MRRPAFAKINLGLRVVGARSDGYHEIRTVFQTISLHDTLDFAWPVRAFDLKIDDPALSAGPDNLVRRAAVAFGRAARVRPRVRIVLHKRIPMGAGLGGGSSDAAVTLAALNRIHGLPLSFSRLTEIASSLGSDVPFFLTGGTALGLGRGEVVRPLRDLDPSSVIVLMPGFHFSTAKVYRLVDEVLTPPRGQTRIYRFSQQGVRGREVIGSVPNDLQRAVARLHPGLGRLLTELRASGAIVAAMSGSGSAVYGLYAGEGQAATGLTFLSRSLPLRSAGSPDRARAFVKTWLGRTIGGAEYSAKVLS